MRPLRQVPPGAARIGAVAIIDAAPQWVAPLVDEGLVVEIGNDDPMAVSWRQWRAIQVVVAIEREELRDRMLSALRRDGVVDALVVD